LTNVAAPASLETAFRQYLDAFDARDLPACLSFFAEDASLTFQSSLYRGKTAIERWHTDRFAADLRIIRLDRVTVEDDQVTADAVVTSNRLRAWKFDSLGGTATVRFENGRISEVNFAARLTAW
jgi:hypothetical protein